MTVIRLTNWQLAPVEANSSADLSRATWQPCSVPGVVQTSSFGLPKQELYRRSNTDRVAWMAQSAWAYRTRFDAPAVGVDEQAVISFRGVDYRCEVRLNGQTVCRHEGMFSHFEILLEPAGRRDNELVVIIHPPGDISRQPREHLKARFAKGWDWAPTLITLGIWDDVELVVRKQLHVRHAWVETRLTNLGRADCVVHAQLSERVEHGEVELALAGVRHKYAIVSADRLRLPVRILNPPLWWPNGMGPATLVDLALDLHVAGRATDTFVIRTGLREVRRVPAAGQRPEDTPLQLLINGRKVFTRGANWVPADCCIADLDRDRYALFLRQFSAARFNLVRVWGGGLIEKQAFYDLADELGLMVMQEFPIANEVVAETERFLRILDAEARDFVPRLNRHPSIVLWSGGNEFYHYWHELESGTEHMQACKRPDIHVVDEETCMLGTNPYHNTGLLYVASLLEELDGTRPHQPTSGMEGEGEPHGIWNWNPRIGDHRMRDYASLYDFWNAQRETWYSEASVESIASLDAIRYVLESDNPAIPDPQDVTWRHHKAFDAVWDVDRTLHADGRSNLWLDLASIDALFGKLENYDDLIAASHFLQAEGGRYLVEELRRKMPQTVGVVWWGANEPWPNLAGNQLIDYFGKPRPALAWLANSFRPAILSLRYRHCVARSIKPELWISHDGIDTFRGTWTVQLEDLTTGQAETFTGHAQCEPYEAVPLRILPYTRLPAGRRVRVTCVLRDKDGQVVHQNTYLFASNQDAAPLFPLLGVIRGLLAVTASPGEPAAR